MSYVALDPAQTEGPEFQVLVSGDYDVFLSGYVATSTVLIQRQSGAAWIGLDTQGEDVATWKSAGGGLVPLLKGVRYRVLVSVGAAGARMTVDPTTEYAAGEPNPVNA